MTGPQCRPRRRIAQTVGDLRAQQRARTPGDTRNAWPCTANPGDCDSYYLRYRHQQRGDDGGERDFLSLPSRSERYVALSEFAEESLYDVDNSER